MPRDRLAVASNGIGQARDLVNVVIAGDEDDLIHIELRVLAAVQTQPAPVSAIAAQLGHTRQSVQRIADLLVDDELAIYRPNPAHKRAKILEINAAGLTALHRLQALFNQLAQRTSAGLEPEHLDLARHTLDELRQRLESELPHLPRD